jgi:hypothetical protein
MDMSVSATGANALREYQKSARANLGAPFAGAAQTTDGTPVNSSTAAHMVGTRTRPEFGTLPLNAAYEEYDIKALNAKAAEMEKHMLETREYDQFVYEQEKQQMQRHEEFFTKMRTWLGGPETAMAIPNDPLGPEPVRTSSGGVHPQSERIKDYIRAHQSEWKKLSYEPPSFEQWQQMRG